MTYASIQEAWGGVSGSNMLSTPLYQRQHPIHQQQKEQFENAPSWKNTNDLYQCTYGSQHCNQVFNRNQQFNEEKKAIAAGIQPFLPGSPGPYNYTFLPQYPWYPWARHSYLMYPPMLSNMWYNNPWAYNPQIAAEIAHNQKSIIPTGTYQPQGFMPYGQSTNPPRKIPHNRREDFTDGKSAAMHSGMIYFIFFLVALAVILVIAMICLCNVRR